MYLTYNYCGGLGNQIFQFIASYNIAKKYGKQLIIKRTDYGGSRPTYWNGILNPISKYFSQVPSVEWTTFKESKYFEYDEIPNYENIWLDGYFQHPLYVEEVRDEMIEFFNFDKYKLPIDLDWERTCCIHFRLGDYKYIYDRPLLLSDVYYENALGCLNTQIDNYLIICEKDDSENVKKRVSKWGLNNVIFISDFNFNDEIEFLCMTKSKVNIIANSTFSWMASYFNKNGIIYYPKKILNGFIGTGLKNWNEVNSTE